MGFGTLFFGYFLLLNITDFFFSDLLMGLLLLLASYKLSSVGREYKSATVLLIPFSLLGLFELIIRIANMLSLGLSSELLRGAVGTARHLLIAAISYLLLLGIQRLAEELELKNLADRARWVKYFNLISFILLAILQIPSLDKVIPAGDNAVKIVAAIGIIALLLSFIASIISLMAIYSAYMHICMPEDLIYKEKPSKFGFINKYREYEAKKQQEYAEYKLDKMAEQQKKKGKKRKK